MTAYYRGAMGILLVYDVTDDKSFNNIRTWMRNIEQHANEQVVKILLGNKCDMTEKKMVTYDQGDALAKEYGIQFFETSAKVQNPLFLVSCIPSDMACSRLMLRLKKHSQPLPVRSRTGSHQTKLQHQTTQLIQVPTPLVEMPLRKRTAVANSYPKLCPLQRSSDDLDPWERGLLIDVDWIDAKPTKAAVPKHRATYFIAAKPLTLCNVG